MPYDFLKQNIKDKRISPPEWMFENLSYMTYFGSIIYGINNDMSDVDIVGIAVPPKEIVFPERFGNAIYGFDNIETFDQWQNHHLLDNVRKREYDFCIYNIVKFVKLASENNPNVLETLFVKENHVVFQDEIGKYLRKNANKFLHKGSLSKFRGYATSQIKKIKNQQNSSNPKRAELVKKFGYDTKFAGHALRLLLEAEQISREGNLVLDRNAKFLRNIREGEWSLEQVENFVETKLIHLEEDFSNSKINESANTKVIKEILMNCLEMKFGNIEKMTINLNENMLKEIQSVLNKYKE